MIDPVILFFLLGAVAGLMRSELRLPAAIYEFVSIVLLLAIGLKGGIELAKQPFGSLLPQMSGTRQKDTRPSVALARRGDL